MSEDTKAVETENTEAAEEKKPASNDVALNAFYAQKAGMTRIFDEKGNHVPVTVVKLIPNKITQVKTQATDGYDAYQVGYYDKREKLINKPAKGHLKKAGVSNHFARFAEVRTETADAGDLGKDVSLANFEANTFIDVCGTSKGKGFQGVMKKYNYAGGPASHGSKFHRTPGSVGQCATPGKIFKNKKMPGQMGNKRETVQNLKIVEVNQDKGYLLIKGSVPGHKNGFIRISKAVKK